MGELLNILLGKKCKLKVKTDYIHVLHIYIWWLFQTKLPQAPQLPGVNVCTSPLGESLGWVEEAFPEGLHEDSMSYFLIAVEIVIKSPRSYTDLLAFVITFFADGYVKLSGISKQNNSALFCDFFWKNVGNSCGVERTSQSCTVQYSIRVYQ